MLLLSLAGGHISAATLGELEVLSYVGSALEARLDVDAGPELLIELGDENAYAAFGLERPGLLADVRILGRDKGGRAVIRSRRPIEDLVLDLVIVVTGDGISEARHYPLLLDFPSLVRTPEATAATPPPRRTSAPPPAPSRSPEPGGPRVTVRPGETLSEIARRNTPAGESVDELADAIYALNPDAFVNGNRNRLLAGARLQLPGGPEGSPGPARAGASVSEREAARPRDDRLELEAPREPDELPDLLAAWIEEEDDTLRGNRDQVARDLNFARTEISTYEQRNEGLKTRIANLESRIESLRRVMALQAELQEQTVAAAAMGITEADVEAQAPLLSAATPEETVSSGIVPAGPATTALVDSALVDSDPVDPALDPQPYEVDYGNWLWFPYVGGLVVCILCGLLFYLRSREERNRMRDRYAKFHEMQQEVRSYLPDQL